MSAHHHLAGSLGDQQLLGSVSLLIGRRARKLKQPSSCCCAGRRRSSRELRDTPARVEPMKFFAATASIRWSSAAD